MTERPINCGAAAAARRRPRFLPTALASLACFAVLFEFLAFQLRAGNDPALGRGPIAAAAPARSTVIDRKIIQRRVVHLPSGAPATTVGGSSASVPASAPVSGATATPAPAAPVAAPAPAPAPVTSSS